MAEKIDTTGRRAALRVDIVAEMRKSCGLTPPGEEPRREQRSGFLASEMMKRVESA